MKNLQDGRKTNVRFRSADTGGTPCGSDTKPFQFLYAEGDDSGLQWIMTITNQINRLPGDLLGRCTPVPAGRDAGEPRAVGRESRSSVENCPPLLCRSKP